MVINEEEGTGQAFKGPGILAKGRFKVYCGTIKGNVLLIVIDDIVNRQVINATTNVKKVPFNPYGKFEKDLMKEVELRSAFKILLNRQLRAPFEQVQVMLVCKAHKSEIKVMKLVLLADFNIITSSLDYSVKIFNRLNGEMLGKINIKYPLPVY